MIDEVDMFLHPQWQQQILQALRGAFPALQCIVTTHSPQRLTTVPGECIRILSAHEVATPAVATLGEESRTTLEDVMHVNSPRDTMADTLQDYPQRINQRDFDSANTCAQIQKIQHPTEADCERYFIYELGDRIVPADNPSAQDSQRAVHTIKALNLNCLRLIRHRAEAISEGYPYSVRTRTQPWHSKPLSNWSYPRTTANCEHFSIRESRFFAGAG